MGKKERYNWWPYAINMIRDYPERKKAYAALHEQKVTASASGLPGAGGGGRTVENVALRQLPKHEQEELEAVEKAMLRTRQLPDGEARLAVVQLTLINGRKLFDAAAQQHISERTARRYRYQFIAMVGLMHGRIEEEEYRQLIKKDQRSENRTPME